MKTRMLFVIQNLERNEASIALLERLYRLSPEKYEVELRVLVGQNGANLTGQNRANHKAGGLYKKIPEYVKILNDNINNKGKNIFYTYYFFRINSDTSNIQDETEMKVDFQIFETSVKPSDIDFCSVFI